MENAKEPNHCFQLKKKKKIYIYKKLEVKIKRVK